MEVKQQDIFKQMQDARVIQDVYLKEWAARVRRLRPEYVSDFLFYKNIGEVPQMLMAQDDDGFVYDPKTLKDGVEMLIKILESQEVYKNDDPKIKVMYTRFGTPEIRIKYLRSIIDKMDIYASIGDFVIADLVEVAKTTKDEEFLEFLQNRINNIKQRAEREKKELQEKRRNQRDFY